MSASPAHAVDETRFVEMIFPDQANHCGTLFCGYGVGLTGKAAFIAATRRARRPVVMARSDRTDFHPPVRVSDLLDMTTTAVRVGRSSMTVEVEAGGRPIPVHSAPFDPLHD